MPFQVRLFPRRKHEHGHHVTRARVPHNRGSRRGGETSASLFRPCGTSRNITAALEVLVELKGIAAIALPQSRFRGQIQDGKVPHQLHSNEHRKSSESGPGRRKMEPSSPDQPAGLKRKRSPGPVKEEREARERAAQAQNQTAAMHATPGSVTQINYLVKAKSERLKLIEGDSESFGEVLAMIDDYEGVLQRHESLAANLGAKLVGPLLVKSFEKLFDGPIKVLQSSFGLDQSPVTWLDIVTFSRTNPSEFVLSETSPGIRTCRVWLKGGQVEISEDDYRLIMSGGPERMIPTQPIPEDESAELGTLNILEARLGMLIKRADTVASKARQLNYHLKGRKTAVLSRKASEKLGSGDDPRTFSPQPFSAINARSHIAPNGEVTKIQQQLLDQFRAQDRRQSASNPRPKAPRLSTSEASNYPNLNGQDADARRMSHPPTSSDDGAEGHYRVLMATKIEKLERGDPIYPPCDRCRRLKFDCTKHLTACQACTKKHAKCSWKDIKEGELEHSPYGPSTKAQAANEENDYDSSTADEPVHFVSSARTPTGATGQLNQSVPVRAELSNPDKRENAPNEHTMLTQIASAAAAAGTR